MKKRIITIAMLVGICTNCTVKAAEIDRVFLSDFDNSIITVTGEEATADNVSIVILKDGETLGVGKYDSSSNLSIQNATVNDGYFSVSFYFAGNAGSYDVYASGNGTPYDFEYVDKATVLKFVEALGDKNIAKDKIADELIYYSVNMNIDTSFMSNDKIKDYVANNIWLYADDIKKDGLEGLKKIVLLSESELEFMTKLKETINFSGVNTLIEAYSTLDSLDTKNYDALSDSMKKRVCNKFIGKSYSDMEEFIKDFETVIKEEKEEKPSTPSKNSGGGGGSVKYNSGSINIPVGIPKEEEKEEEKEEYPGLKLLEEYDDLNDVSWAWDSILYMYENDIMTGVGNKKFMPNENVKREQVAKIITCAFDKFEGGLEHEFVDVPKDEWASPYIAVAKKYNLMVGLGENTFGYGKDVSREDICVIVYRAAVANGYIFDEKNTNFEDYDEISDYAKDAVAYLSGAGVINGVSDSKFEPKASATRAQIAKIIYTTLTNLK